MLRVNTECYVLHRRMTYEMLTGERPHDCPLIEIPPHGRLIDAGVFEEMLNSKGGVELKNVPTVIESEEE